MDPAYVGHILGNRFAREQPPRFGVDRLTDRSLRALAMEAWDGLGCLVVDGPQDVAAFIAAYESAYHARAAGYRGRPSMPGM